MSLQIKIMEAIKVAMKNKNTVALESLRAIKSAILLAQTESGAKEQISEADEIKLLQKLVKQRKDSAEIYKAQGRLDLAEPEMAQAQVIEQFLPEQLSEAELETIIRQIIVENKADGMTAMGKIMGLATTQLAGRANGKTISELVKKLLN